MAAKGGSEGEEGGAGSVEKDVGCVAEGGFHSSFLTGYGTQRGECEGWEKEVLWMLFFGGL